MSEKQEARAADGGEGEAARLCDIAKAPCKSCPYRVDVPSGLWAKGWELINVVANWNGQTGAYLGVYSYTVLWKRPTPQSTEGQAR